MSHSRKGAGEAVALCHNHSGSLNAGVAHDRRGGTALVVVCRGRLGVGVQAVWVVGVSEHFVTLAAAGAEDAVDLAVTLFAGGPGNKISDFRARGQTPPN